VLADTASATDSTLALPSVIHMSAANCATMVLRDGHYEFAARNPWEPEDFTSVWTVLAFTKQLVVFHRHDSRNPANRAAPNGWDVTYTAQISADGNTLVNVTENGVPAANLHFAWGSALDSVPGSNAERDRRARSSVAQANLGDGQPAEVPSGQSVANTVATNPPAGAFKQNALPLSAVEDWEAGVRLATQAKYEDAIQAYQRAAALGDADAAFELGWYAEYGIHCTKDLPLAIKWYTFARDNGQALAGFRLSSLIFHGKYTGSKETWLEVESKAGEDGSSDATADLAMIYRNGVTGVAPDPGPARYWLEKTHNYKNLAFDVVNTDDIKAKMAEAVDNAVNGIENVAIMASLAGPLDAPIQRTPSHRIVGIEITKFTGHVKQASNTIDFDLPFEIECKERSDPPYFMLHFRINNVIEDGTPRRVITAANWVQEMVFTQADPQMVGEETFGVHDITN
jgi:Sel1 repeat